MSDQVLVNGVGVYTRNTLKKDVANKLRDMIERLDRDDCHTLGQSQLEVLGEMWKALGRSEDA